MEMRDFEAVWEEHEQVRRCFLIACEELYLAIRNNADEEVIKERKKRCDYYDLAVRSADKDLKECLEREAMISTYKEN